MQNMIKKKVKIQPYETVAGEAEDGQNAPSSLEMNNIIIEICCIKL